MSVTWSDGVTWTVEVALSSATDVYGLWGDGRWGSALWGPGEQWQDFSGRLRSFSTNRRFSREVAEWQSGTATVVLGNADGHLSPSNMDSPYVVAGVTGIRPWRPIRIRAAYAGVTYDVYTGYVVQWAETWPADGKDAIITLSCVDEKARLARWKGLATTPVGAGELSGLRMHRILDAAGHRGPRQIDSGTVTMQATDLSGDATAQLQLTADSEGGAWWVDAGGAVRGARQYALLEEDRSVNVQATFADDGSGIGYQDLTVPYDGDLIVNVVSYTRVGGTAQTVSDPTSRALYAGDQSDVRTDLICETDDQVLTLANWKLLRFKDPEQRASAVSFMPRRDPATMIPIALGLRERDLVRAIRTPPVGTVIDRYCHVAGISHTVTAQRAWTVRLDLFSATPYLAFADSRWDVGTWGSAAWF